MFHFLPQKNHWIASLSAFHLKMIDWSILLQLKVWTIHSRVFKSLNFILFLNKLKLFRNIYAAIIKKRCLFHRLHKKKIGRKTYWIFNSIKTLVCTDCCSPVLNYPFNIITFSEKPFLLPFFSSILRDCKIFKSYLQLEDKRDS